MNTTNNSRDAPASLFLYINDSDIVEQASIKETSDDYTRQYVSWKVENVKGYDAIPDEEIVEYRFPNRHEIPPLKPGFENEYYARDMYYALEGKNIPGLHISLRMAAFLIRNNADPLQPEEVYRRLSKCPEYREFIYLNYHGLLKHPGLVNADDTAKLAAIRAEGGLSLAEILSEHGRVCVSTKSDTVESAANGSKKLTPKTVKPPGRRIKPRIPVKRNSNPKRTRGCSL